MEKKAKEMGTYLEAWKVACKQKGYPDARVIAMKEPSSPRADLTGTVYVVELSAGRLLLE